MIVVPIFDEANPVNLWAACYPEDDVEGSPIDVFSKLFDQWNDITYLQPFFVSNASDLALPIWNGISIDEAIDQVLDEAAAFESQLIGIELQHPGYKGQSLSQIFKPLNKNEYVLKRTEESFRKGRPASYNSMLRLYGIALEDDCMVITGGAIKLVDKMEKRPHLEHEIRRLKRVQDYLKSEHIYSRDELEQL